MISTQVEGHEPKVLRGMHLERGYAKRFPLFQYELGGTWGHHDPRHNNDWTQGRAAGYLQNAGYELYLVATCVEIKFRAPHAIDAMLSP